MIDAGLPTSWDESAVAAANLFRQGHLVKVPPFFYVASARHGLWELTRSAGDPEATEESFELADEDRPPYGLITTQTCDIQEVTPRQPWVQIAPVYRATNRDPSWLALLEQHRISHLVPLEPPGIEGDHWVVDLRLEVPVEKSWLVGRTPIEAFPTDTGYERLAERLAGARERPALADSLVNGIAKPLAKWLKKKIGSNAATRVDEIRLRVGGTRLEPASAALLLVSSDRVLSPDEQEPWERWWDGVRANADPAGPALLSIEYATLDTIAARVWVESVPLNFGYLSRD